MLLALVLCALPNPVRGDHEPDLIQLPSGDEIECRVLFEDDQKVLYRAQRKTHEVARSEVKEIQSIERSLREFLARSERVSARDTAALAELALFAESRYLAGEAHNAWLRILTVDPAHEQAWTKLGGVKRRNGWELKVRGRFLDVQELRERAGDWKNALELRTAHFLIQTDAPPERALDVALDVERAYLTFQDVLGKPIGLLVLDEVPEIHIFADPEDYPAPPTPGKDAWFSVSANTVYVNARENRHTGTIVAEFTEALLFNAFRRTLGKAGQLDPWVLEGVKQAFAAGVRPDPGRTRFEFEAPFQPWFERQARDAEALELSQVLRAGLASFSSGSDAPRYSAQSYTLTHFLVFSGDGKYRARFAQFLRESTLGKGGASNFFAALGVQEKALAEEWKAYVKARAGG
jgi:hypothetical protein